MSDEIMDGGAEDDILDKRRAIKDVVLRQSTVVDYDSSWYGYTYIRPEDVPEFLDELYKAAGLA